MDSVRVDCRVSPCLDDNDISRERVGRVFAPDTAAIKRTSFLRRNIRDRKSYRAVWRHRKLVPNTGRPDGSYRQCGRLSSQRSNPAREENTLFTQTTPAASQRLQSLPNSLTLHASAGLLVKASKSLFHRVYNMSDLCFIITIASKLLYKL